MAEPELERDVEGAADEQEAATPATTDRQPETPRVPNLDELPDFRKWKSDTDRRISEAQREAQAARLETQRYQERVKQMEMQGLDDVGKLNYYAREQELRAQRAEQQLQQLAELRAWDREIAKIAAKTGADMDELNQATDISSAWEMGYEHAKKQSSTTKRTPASTPEPESEPDLAHTVDVGRGSNPSVAEAIQRKYDKAVKDKDANAMLDAMVEADSKGVAINE